MKKNIDKNFLLLLFILIVLNSSAQDRIMHGMVTTFDSIPIIGAEIIVKSTKQVVQSDTLGRFSVGVIGNDKLKVKAHGFNTANVKLKDNIKVVAVNLQLKPGEKGRAYAIGYGHVLDKEKLNAVSQINKDDVDFSMYSNIYELMRGRFSGVQIMSNGDIIIRGINSINSSSAALIVVDGMVVDKSMLNSLPPVQVKNINIIKDGSSAIYGSRGANGVVIIETKRGGDE
jgi:TonB-dependent SusC/RagA subfamily outer membrane receptor